MATRVLATPEAQSAITQIENILNNGLTQTITDLDTQGKTLSEPNVWDGNKADDFRNNVWPSVQHALQSATQQLQELQGKLQGIHHDIMAAGGNT
ncbi:hypothetical protein K6U06_10000 [Acidiferrimicrobium sp. IK]|uniref:hypothetical protein n=1 Tax=Acidiferrimicrobium sp. IK TaxID=2871700 RepID=UPI0021CB1FEC|nr:hypothetical protein [Acidiferrimicrobium sp. IK]MCU4184692.1 hypothetical protein [Acidiferrimicrobium sp. IK]